MSGKGTTIVITGQCYLWDRKLSDCEIQQLYGSHNSLFRITGWKLGKWGPEPVLEINQDHPLASGLVAVYLPYGTETGTKVVRTNLIQEVTNEDIQSR